MNWIVKNEEPQLKQPTFAEKVQMELEAEGINPADWTDEELEDWRNISDNHWIRRKAR